MQLTSMYCLDFLYAMHHECHHRGTLVQLFVACIIVSVPSADSSKACSSSLLEHHSSLLNGLTVVLPMEPALLPNFPVSI